MLFRSRYTRQYIADCKGADDNKDDLDSIDEAIEALIVTDTLSNDQANQEPAEHFITSFGALQPHRAFDITTNLANRSLTHALIQRDKDATHVDPVVIQ